MRKRGRPARADRRILQQQTGYSAEAVDQLATLFEKTGGQQEPTDLRLWVRFGAWRLLGFSRDDSLERAGAWPDLYNYHLRQGEPKDVALRKALAWSVGSALPSDLQPEERPAHVSPARVRLALERLREAREQQISSTFRYLSQSKRLPLNQAILETCRMCGMGPGRADAEGRGEGLSETIAALRAAGFDEVADSKLHSPRARRSA